MKPEGDDAGAAPPAQGMRPAQGAAAPSPDASSSAPGAGRAARSSPCRAIASEALFGGASEVHISHRGSLYRLKQTALGKLILTK